jgi:hypothetical protein
MSRWTDIAQTGNGTDVQKLRPQGFGLFQENTTVTASWIEMIDTKEESLKFNRTLNNVTLAMPHSGIFQAARGTPENNIMQPEVGPMRFSIRRPSFLTGAKELDGLGMYNIRASLPSPYINTLCANVLADEIAPIVYEAQTGVTLNATKDLPTQYTFDFPWGNFSSVQTPVDKIFGWDAHHRPPIFYKYPINFNTVGSPGQR